MQQPGMLHGMLRGITDEATCKHAVLHFECLPIGKAVKG